MNADEAFDAFYALPPRHMVAQIESDEPMNADEAFDAFYALPPRNMVAQTESDIQIHPMFALNGKA